MRRQGIAEVFEVCTAADLGIELVVGDDVIAMQTTRTGLEER